MAGRWAASKHLGSRDPFDASGMGPLAQQFNDELGHAWQRPAGRHNGGHDTKPPRGGLWGLGAGGEWGAGCATMTMKPGQTMHWLRWEEKGQCGRRVGGLCVQWPAFRAAPCRGTPPRPPRTSLALTCVVCASRRLAEQSRAEQSRAEQSRGLPLGPPLLFYPCRCHTLCRLLAGMPRLVLCVGGGFDWEGGACAG